MFPLSAVLGVSPGTVVSLAGAGGKTSLLFALVREAVERWGAGRVLVTTTTRMFEPGPADFPPLCGEGGAAGAGHLSAVAPAGAPVPPVRTLICGTLGEALAELERTPGEAVPVLAQGVLPPSGGLRSKLLGVPAAWVVEIARRFPHLLILVEADGSAGRPLKAPGGHEPVIPSSAGTVLAVAGMDALGAPLDPSHVHRPEQVARLTGLLPGEPVTPWAMGQVLWHLEGCGKGRPPGSRLIPVLNQVDSTERLGAARRVAAELVGLGSPVVVLTNCRKWPVVVEAVRSGKACLRGGHGAGGGPP
ncbi:MAG: selenium cofactor biosynthesis protein YqeC [Bacillota bacterium]|nr:selenium cofactor biosynthesis protein YqeC [Bacillota bacterium]